ncbi:MAG: Gfo/Idh/MocA family oxidoreductase [Rhodobacterales bacterium]|nr:Gfo/Idh/MocA family oxidoreductase [Rhodobacterales bacterium]
MATKTRWAVVGVGRAGIARSRAIQADPFGALVCTWRGRNQHLLDCSAATDLTDALRQVDAVAICSPDVAHGDQIGAALRANKHVVVEFPICHSSTEAAALFELARTMDKTLHVAHIELLHGPQRLLHEALQRPTSSASLAFSRPGPLGSARELAFGNIARLHRLVDLFGPVTHLQDLDYVSGALSGVLITTSTRVMFHFEQAPALPRSTLLKVGDSSGNWKLTGRQLSLNDTARILTQTTGLFSQDQNVATARIMRGCSHYVTETQILHILRLAEQLSNLEEGRLRPAFK